MESLKIMGVSDVNVNAMGMMEARKYGIATSINYVEMISEEIEIIIDATGNEKVFTDLREKKSKETVVIPGSMAKIMMSLIKEKEVLIEKLRRHQQELDIILNSTHDGMIAVNQEGLITLFNRAAERIIGISNEEVLGSESHESILNSVLLIKRLHKLRDALLSWHENCLVTYEFSKWNIAIIRIGKLLRPVQFDCECTNARGTNGNLAVDSSSMSGLRNSGFF